MQRVFAAGESVALAFQLAHASDPPPNVTVRYVLPTPSARSSPAWPCRGQRGCARIEDYDLTGPSCLASRAGMSAAIEASDGRHAERREVLLTVR